MKQAPLIAHLDLKGIQYRAEYYEAYFENLKQLGFEGVLVEYEDVFPFRSASLWARPDEVWSTDFLSHFLKLAAEAGIEVIPLQQCLGHLEYAFRSSKNHCYSIPQGELRDLDITRPEAREWLKGLLEEMLEAHPDSRLIHLGMDEAGGFVRHAKATGHEPLGLFLEYLGELCDICERHGKTPLIWSDMLEDHLTPENLKQLVALRERVILVPWNYVAGVHPESVVRFSGFRCSRRWMEDPQSGPADASPVWDDLRYFEDWAPEIKELTDEFRISPWLMEPLFQAAIWKRLGFRVWGGAGGSITQDRTLLPYYNRREANIRCWKETAQRHQLDGLIITHWQRSNSCTVLNVIPDTVWPILAKAASPDDSAAAFFPEADNVDHLIFMIGKCREGWLIQNMLIEKLEQQQVTGHSYEWKTLILMLRVLRIHQLAAQREEQVGCYAGIGRLNARAWEGHSDHLKVLRKQLLDIRPEVEAHLKQRYYGHALEEWLYKVFSVPLETLDRLEESVANSISSFKYHDL